MFRTLLLKLINTSKFVWATRQLDCITFHYISSQNSLYRDFLGFKHKKKSVITGGRFRGDNVGDSLQFSRITNKTIKSMRTSMLNTRTTFLKYRDIPAITHKSSGWINRIHEKVSFTAHTMRLEKLVSISHVTGYRARGTRSEHG